MKFIIALTLLLLPLVSDARIGMTITELENKLKNGLRLGDKFEELPNASLTANHPYTARFRYKLEYRKPDQDWLLDALAWAGTGIIYEMTYQRLDQPVGEKERIDIIRRNSPPDNSRPPYDTPKPNRRELVTPLNVFLDQAGPVNVRIKAEELDELLEFKDRWLCIGQTRQQMVRRFGAGTRIFNNNPDILRFRKLDKANQISWDIEVKMWQDVGDREPVVHRVKYCRRDKFTAKELEFLREINAKGAEWEENGFLKPWSMFATKNGQLLAGSHELSQEMSIGTRNLDAHEKQLPHVPKAGANELNNNAPNPGAEPNSLPPFLQ